MYGVLARRADFLRVYQRHSRVSGQYFTLLVHPCYTEAPRAGLVVSRKVGKAVRRNLVKRRLRAYLREHIEHTTMQRDIIVIARPGSAEATWQQHCQDLDRLFARGMRAIAKSAPCIEPSGA